MEKPGTESVGSAERLRAKPGSMSGLVIAAFPFPSSGNDPHITGLAVLACGVLLAAAVIVVIVQMIRERR